MLCKKGRICTSDVKLEIQDIGEKHVSSKWFLQMSLKYIWGVIILLHLCQNMRVENLTSHLHKKTSKWDIWRHLLDLHMFLLLTPYLQKLVFMSSGHKEDVFRRFCMHLESCHYMQNTYRYLILYPSLSNFISSVLVQWLSLAEKSQMEGRRGVNILDWFWFINCPQAPPLCF